MPIRMAAKDVCWLRGVIKGTRRFPFFRQFALTTVFFFIVCAEGFGALTPARLTLAKGSSLSITGAVGTLYAIQYATNLSQANPWHVISLANLPSSPYVVSNTAPATKGSCYYRAVAMSRTNMVWIPAGSFVMGSPTNEVGRFSDESPQTTVAFTLPLWMGPYLVRQQDYQSVMATNPSGYTGDLTRPVETVTWEDATNYCAHLTQQELASGKIPGGFQYRLPTEAEWEYACRAGSTNRFNYGDDPGYTNLVNHAWYTANGAETTHPVGQKPPNAWGLYDMHGNVWEWCQDWYDTYPGGSVTNPQGPTIGTSRVLRGGSWDDIASFCRSACRIADDPETAAYLVYGFRVVLAPIP